MPQLSNDAIANLRGRILKAGGEPVVLSKEVVANLYKNQHGHIVAQLESVHGADVAVKFPAFGKKGMSADELKDTTGVKDAVFAMKAGICPVFIAESKEGALKLARLALGEV